MKRKGFIALTVLLILLILLILFGAALIVLNSTSVQHRLIQSVTQTFVDKSGSQLEVERASINVFRGMVLHHVVVKDSIGTPFLTVKRLEIGIRLLPLLKNRIECHAFRFINASVHLTRTSPGAPLNVERFIQSFTSDKLPKNKWSFNIEHIYFKACDFTYDVLSEPNRINQFDQNHLEIKGLTSMVRFSVNPGTKQYFLSVEKMNVVDCFGLTIDQLAFKLDVTNKQAVLENVLLETPGSRVSCQKVAITYPNLSKIRSQIDSIQCAPLVVKGRILPVEWAFLYPTIASITEPVSFSLSLHGTAKEVVVRRVWLSAENWIQLEGSAVLERLTATAEPSVAARISLFNLFPAGLDCLWGLLPNPPQGLAALKKLGAVGYMGNIGYKANTLTVKGDITTLLGQVSTNCQVGLAIGNNVSLSGQFTSSGINLSRITSQPSDWGTIAFHANVEGVKNRDSTLSGQIEGTFDRIEYAGYAYHNAVVKGTLKNERLVGAVKLEDPNAVIDIEGWLDFAGDSVSGQALARVKGVDLHALHVIKKGTSSKLDVEVNARFSGNKRGHFSGDLEMTQLSYIQNGKQLNVDRLTAKAIQTDTLTVFDVHSALVDATLSGQFKTSQLKTVFDHLFHQYVPSAFTSPHLSDPTIQSDIDVHAALYPSEALMRVLNVPFNYTKTINVDAFYRYQTNKFRVKAVAPLVTYGKSTLTSVNFLLENPLNEIKCIAHAMVGKEDNPMNVDLDVRTMNDQSVFKLFWSNTGLETHTGTIQGGVRFSRSLLGQSVIDMTVKPSDIVVNDSVWHIHPTTITVNNKRIYVEAFQLSHRDEFIRVNGFASENLNDTLFVSFNAFRLDDIFRMMPNNQLLFGGRITGLANCPHLLKNGTMEAELSVEAFSINNQVLGNLSATTRWNMERRKLELAGAVKTNPIANQPSRIVATAVGDYSPFSDSLELSVDTKQVSLNFLDPYLNTVIQDLNAVVTGHVRITGPLKRIGIYAQTFVERASFNIDLLNTTYWFSDSIFLTPTQISFRNIKVIDREGNVGYASCMIRHNRFKQMKTQLDITINNMLVMDLPATTTALFYGTAYGSGTISIVGHEENTRLDVNMRTEDRTKVTISPLVVTDELDNNFIQFVDFNKRYRKLVTRAEQPTNQQPTSLLKEPSNFTVNLQIEATPNAELILITDPNTGDEIRARGSGAIRAVFDEKSTINLLGRYTIDNGSYKFVYENIIRRDFSIVRGSTINFSGNPFAAQLDIIANYTVDAQLSDLIPTSELASLNLVKNSIPVNCVLMLGGELQRPDIKLDLAYPSADDELIRRIRNVINTEAMMNQQLVYLLLFGRFSSPSTNSSGQSNMSSVLNTAISTLSSQVNSTLNNAIGYTNLSFDVNYQNAAYESGTPGEFKVGVSGQWLDDRLTIKGNLGSRENLAQTGTSQFIGEFDMNLRMKNSEKWSWKFFNRANDNKYFKSALNTQGFGVVYSEEYNNFGELFNQMIESIKKPFSKKTKPQTAQ